MGQGFLCLAISILAGIAINWFQPKPAYARFVVSQASGLLQDVLNAQALQKRDGKLAAIVVFHWKSNVLIAGKLLF